MLAAENFAEIFATAGDTEIEAVEDFQAEKTEEREEAMEIGTAEDFQAEKIGEREEIQTEATEVMETEAAEDFQIVNI